VNFLANPSDNRLIAVALAGALGCKPWAAVDLAAQAQGNQVMLPAVPLNEAFAAFKQKAPQALIPVNDPMAKSQNMAVFDVKKVNGYRKGVLQPPVASQVEGSAKNFCKRLYALQPARILLDKQFTNTPGSSPAPAVANTLFGFLVNRLNQAVGAANLNCVNLLNLPVPFNFMVDGAGVVMEATITLNPASVIPALTKADLELTGIAALDILQGNGDLVTM